MSECVVRMEKPENCEKCRLRVNDSPTNVPDWICAINQWPTFYCKKSQNHADEDKYLQDCPISCSLPEGHGDLIDRDVLLQTFQNADYETYNDYCEAFDTTEAAETIVPAEAERSET